MTPADTDDTTNLPVDVRAAELELSDGGLAVYDPRNHNAWIQTNLPVSLEQYR